MGEGELRVGVVHDDDVTHARGSGSAGDGSTIEDEDFEAGAGAFSGTSSTDNPSAHDDEVEGFGHGVELKALKR
jgi:hypothetical protein